MGPTILCFNSVVLWWILLIICLLCLTWGGIYHGKGESFPTIGKFFLVIGLKGNTDLIISCPHYIFLVTIFNLSISFTCLPFCFHSCHTETNNNNINTTQPTDQWQMIETIKSSSTFIAEIRRTRTNKIIIKKQEKWIVESYLYE
jgi:hypothetical protein